MCREEVVTGEAKYPGQGLPTVRSARGERSLAGRQRARPPVEAMDLILDIVTPGAEL